MPPDRFDDAETGSGDWLVRDRGTDDARMRSALYLARESCD